MFQRSTLLPVAYCRRKVLVLMNRVTKHYKIDGVSGNIVELYDNAYILVGTNSAGSHGGGLALQASLDFGLVSGHSQGLCGQTYCIDTMSGTEKISPQLSTMLRWMLDNPEAYIVCTRIGEGIAGIPHARMKSLWQSALGKLSEEELRVVRPRLLLFDEIYGRGDTKVVSFRVPLDKEQMVRDRVKELL